MPSVVIPSETNYLINPSHPKFPELEIGSPSLRQLLSTASRRQAELAPDLACSHELRE